MEAIYIALRADAAKNQKSGIRGSSNLPEILTQGCIPQVDLPQKISALHHQRFESYAQFWKNVFYRPVIY